MWDAAELELRGWTRIANVGSSDDVLALASRLGTPLPSANGDLMKKLSVVPTEEGAPSSLSAQFGTGAFPLHTDTAFWSRPARYLLMRVDGDKRRPTTILTFRRVLDGCSERVKQLIGTTSWKLRTPSINTYCSMQFRLENTVGWRYDRQCMSPANRAAREVDEAIQAAFATLRPEEIDWSESGLIVVSNWAALHGRGSGPIDEGERILERLYVG